MSSEQDKNKIRKPKLKLPFTDKKSDVGEWAFDHRIGLCITVIAYLLFAIVFVCSKIFVGEGQHTQGFYIDIEDISKLEELRDKLEQEVAQKEEFDWSSVSNQRSNESSLEQRVTDDRGTNTAELDNEAARAQEAMEANRQAYQDAINKIEQEREEGRKQGSEENRKEQRDVKRQGNVTVSYSFVNPVRHAQNLIVPAYQCQDGGEVVIEVQLDQKGRVTAAKVARGGDKCMQETALSAAKRSTFNAASDAPNPHTGTISYIFIPQ